MKKLRVQAWILLILSGHHLTFVLSQIPACRWRINVGANTSGLKEFVLMFSVYLCLNVLLNVREFNEFCCQSLIKCQKFAKYSSYSVSRLLRVLFSHKESLWLSKLYITFFQGATLMIWKGRSLVLRFIGKQPFGFLNLWPQWTFSWRSQCLNH